MKRLTLILVIFIINVFLLATNTFATPQTTGFVEVGVGFLCIGSQFVIHLKTGYMHAFAEQWSFGLNAGIMIVDKIFIPTFEVKGIYWFTEEGTNGFSLGIITPFFMLYLPTCSLYLQNTMFGFDFLIPNAGYSFKI